MAAGQDEGGDGPSGRVQVEAGPLTVSSFPGTSAGFGKLLKPPRIEVGRTNMKDASSGRAYRQTARAASAEATGRRIIDAFLTRLSEQWYDEIRLEQVAEDAGVTVQTVVRRFGGKAGLLDEAVPAMVRNSKERRISPPCAPEQIIRSLVVDYERTGDIIIRLLGLEPRHAVLHEHLTQARGRHRDW